MELSQIRNFIALAEGESMSATAERMGVSQPSLSRSIGSLEQELGVQLFDRRNGRIFLNEYGRDFLPYAQTAMSSLTSGFLSVKRDIFAVKGTVRIVCQAFADGINACTADYLRLNPEVNVSVFQKEPDPDTAGKIDFYYTPVPPRRSADGENVWESCLLFEENYYVAVAPSLLDLSTDTVTPSELRGVPFVTMPMASYFYRDITYPICESAGFSPWVVSITDDFNTKTALVDEGVGAAMYPTSCLRIVKLLAPKARLYRITGYDALRRLYLARKKKSLMSETARDFWNFVLDYFDIPNRAMRV